MDEIKSAYALLKQKYNLPAYEEMAWEYEICSIDEDELLIRNIRKKITEKIEYLATVLSSIIQPETDAANLHEVSFFDDAEKEEVIKIYKRLMYHFKTASRLVVDDNEEDNANFIKDAHVELVKLKPQLIKYFDKMKDCWTKEIKKKEEAGYFG